MTVAELRLELLRLTYSHGREAQEAVDRANILERFVVGEEALTPGIVSDEPKRRPGRPRITRD